MVEFTKRACTVYCVVDLAIIEIHEDGFIIRLRLLYITLINGASGGSCIGLCVGPT